jgi:hypothetical protein
MELSPSWEAASCAATRFSQPLRNPKLYYRVHKNPPLVPFLSQINPVHTTPSYLSKVNLIFIHPSKSDLFGGLFLSGFPTSIRDMIPLRHHSCYLPYPSHPPWLLLILQGWKKKTRRNQHDTSSSFCFLLGLVSDSDDGGDISLRDVCWILADYMAL